MEQQQLSMQQLIANGTTTLRNGIAEMPFWAEEVALVVAIATVYIIVHHGLTFIQKECRSGASHRKLLEDEPTPLSRPMTRPGPWNLAQRFYSGSVDNPATHLVPLPKAQAATHTPKTSRDFPGITDRRFTGVVISYKPEEGYGFIQCPELHDIFGRDVFLHRLQIGRFDVGAYVSFGIFLNKNSQPQAKELAPPSQPEELALPADALGFAPQKTKRLPPKPLPRLCQQQQWRQQQQQQHCNDVARSMGRPTWEELMKSQPASCEAWLSTVCPTGEPRSTLRNREAGTISAD
eukprot:CAMPEP_0172666852 /NCGR_PEP_ID=MMETSP1074-20121228/8065_1 /TAXON_ID=2916 /ORGANISM="Ceratium fusus, Strain PA161109" /LENGTH=291 /DNA_ID=CAMNT_0013483287 /DNA_START=21 /DNA_END=896 /DNA_ORIENTATION=+